MSTGKRTLFPHPGGDNLFFINEGAARAWWMGQRRTPRAPATAAAVEAIFACPSCALEVRESAGVRVQCSACAHPMHEVKQP